MQSVSSSNPAAKIVPDAASNLSKKDQVAEMFNNIAGRYDFLNHFLSMGIDKGWRKKAIAEVAQIQPKSILDVATGTGDMAIAAARKIQPQKITGVDIADQMLAVGRKKIADKNLAGIITLQTGDSEAMPFATGEFDAVMCAYGVRNFEHLEAGLKEMSRVLRPGGKVVILEFSHPIRFPVKQLYKFYFRYILPTLGKIVSKHSKAYTYLPESVMAFPEGKRFCEILGECGFKNAVARPLTFGITTLYTANKSSSKNINFSLSSLIDKLNNKEIFIDWTLSYKEVSNNVYKVELIDKYGRQASYVDSNLENAIDTSIGYAFDIQKQLNKNWNKFLFDVCKLKLSGFNIIEANYDEQIFGSWGIYLPDVKIILDGRESIIYTENKQGNNLYSGRKTLKIADLSYDQLKSMLTSMEI